MPRITHGQSKTRLHKEWKAIRSRCSNPHNVGYHNYGGRGITVCPEWQRFEVFRDWALAHGYRDDLTIERINNDGNYEPGNCSWIPKSQQTSNTRRCLAVTFQGRTQNLKAWATELGLPYYLLWNRVSRGWPMEAALTTPPIPYESRSTCTIKRRVSGYPVKIA